MICWKCGKEIAVESVYRNTDCPSCHADLHSCRGCSFYSKESHFECRETVSEPVTDKERANFCDYFSVNKNLIPPSSSSTDKAKAAKDAFNALFG